MVENRPWLTIFTHIMLLLGILIMFFPIYLAFVASTHTLADILKTPKPLLPGSALVGKLQPSFCGRVKRAWRASEHHDVE
jgi:sn-glycerol 3-phosphate transport system permease protein